MSTRPNTQSELIAQLLDPELSGALLNSVSSSFKEGRDTAVVAKNKVSKATRNQASWALNPQHSVATVTQGNRSPMFQLRTPICSTYLTRLVSNS